MLHHPGVARVGGDDSVLSAEQCVPPQLRSSTGTAYRIRSNRYANGDFV